MPRVLQRRPRARLDALMAAAIALLQGAPGCASTSSAEPAAGTRGVDMPALLQTDEPAGTRAGLQAPAVAPQAADSTADADGQVTLSAPAMVGPLTANPHPMRLDAGDLGPIYVTGAASGLGMLQDHEAPGDHGSQADTTNAQVILQKAEGWFQFHVQAGAYSLPALGTPYVRASDAADAFYGTVPTAFVKLAPEDEFSIMAGKLPTLFGAEYTFTFENMNVERGLLWN
jgi:hypothetical protein